MAGQRGFVALGRSKQATFFSLLRKALIVAPMALLLPRLGLGVKGVFLSEPISDFIGTFMLTEWKKLSIPDKIRA